MAWSGWILVLSAGFYLGATWSALGYFRNWNLAQDVAAGRFLALGITVHVIFLAFRWEQTGFIPLTAFSEVLAVLGLCLSIGLALTRMRVRIPVLSSLFLPLIVLFTLASIVAGPTPGPEIQPQFKTTLLAVHILCNLLGYSYFTLGFFTGLAFYIQEGRLKEHKIQAWTFHLPSLETMDRLTVRFTAWGFVFWTLGIALGILNAIKTDSKLSAYDPKIISAWCVWGLYALYFALRWGLRMRGKKALALAVAGYLLSLFTFFGVKLLMTTHHTFGLGS